MKLSPPVLLACVVQVVLRYGVALSLEVPAVEEIEREAITYRVKNVKQGYVRMRVSSEEPSPRKTECLYEITFDPHRVQQNRRCRLRGKIEWGKPQIIIVTPERYIEDNEHTKLPTAVHIAPATNYKTPKEHLRVFNIQALGMDANGADGLHTAHVEALVNRSDRSPPMVREDTRQGMKVWKIDYNLKSQQILTESHVSLWIAPSQGSSIVGIEVESRHNGKRYTSVIDSDMKKYPTGNIWYPSKVIKTVKVDNRIVDRQVIIVEDAQFGGPIDETAFTPAALNLKAGRKVIDSTSGQPWGKIWDGKELADPSGVPTSPGNPNRRPWLLWAIAAGLGLLAVFYLRRVIQHRKTTANPGT